MGGISKNDLIIKYQKEFISQFKDKDFVTALAPGRINIIGEHTDYNLGLAIPIAIDRWICSVISIREDREINICASNFKDHISLDIDNLNINKKIQIYHTKKISHHAKCHTPHTRLHTH